MNAKVGSQQLPRQTSKFGFRVQNEVRKRLTEYCQENTLVIANILFQQYKRWLNTWTSPDGQNQNQFQKVPESSRKTHTSALLTMLKPLTVWITTNYRKFFKRWEYWTTLPASWEICMQVKKQQLEPDMEEQTSSRLGKEYGKTVFCHPAYLSCMQSTSCEIPGRISTS